MAAQKTPQALVADAKKQLAADKRRGQSLLALIERRKARITEDFYDIGEALRELSNNRLYAALGFDTFEQLLNERRVMSRTQAFKLIRLVDSIPRDEALRLGQEKSYALVTYTAATPEQDVPAALVRRNAKIDGKPLSQLTKRELEDAAKAVHAKVKRPTNAETARLKAIKALEKKARTLLKKAGITTTTIQLKQDVILVAIPRSWIENVAID